MPGATSKEPLNFVRWRLILVAPQYETCFMSPRILRWHLVLDLYTVGELLYCRRGGAVRCGAELFEKQCLRKSRRKFSGVATGTNRDFSNFTGYLLYCYYYHHHHHHHHHNHNHNHHHHHRISHFSASAGKYSPIL